MNDIISRVLKNSYGCIHTPIILIIGYEWSVLDRRDVFENYGTQLDIDPMSSPIKLSKPNITKGRD